MKKLQLLVIGLFCMCAIGTQSYAQNCQTCPAPGWQTGDIVVTAATPTGCGLMVNYRYCPATNVIEITYINKIPGGTCSITPMEVIMQAAIRGVLRESNIIMRQRLPYTVTIQTPSCWEDDFGYGLQPCNNTSCCVTEYDMVQSPEGHIVIESSTTLFTNPCSPVGGCQDMCDAHEQPINTMLYDEGGYFLCETNCNTPWNIDANNWVEETFSNGVVVIAHYAYRNCSGQIEMCLLSFHVVANPNGVSMNEVFRQAVRTALKGLANRQYLNAEIIRLKKCWNSPDAYPLGSVGNYYGCALPFDCCSIEVRVSTTNITNVFPGTFNSPVDDCSDPTSCFEFCDELLNLTTGSFVYKKAQIEFDEPVLENSTEVLPNPTDGVTQIRLNSSIEGNAELKIFDLRGIEITTIMLEKTSQFATWEIDATEFVSGAYVFNITIDGQYITSGKFIVE